MASWHLGLSRLLGTPRRRLAEGANGDEARLVPWLTS